MAGQLSFDTTGITIPTTQGIRAAWVARFVSIFTQSDPDVVLNTEPSSPLGQIIDALVAELEAKNAEIAFLANQYSRKQAAGVFLDALNSLYFLDRKKAAATVVQCTCTGAAGTTIPFGALVADAEGRRFRCLTAAQIGADGTALVDFESVEVGALDVQAGTVTRIITTIPGWDSVSNPAAGVAGRVRESDAEFRDRAAESVAANSHGTVDAIRSAIAELDGVIDVEVLENFRNTPATKWGVELSGHSVCVAVEGGDPTAIAQAIYQKKSPGCDTVGNTQVDFTTDSGVLYSFNVLRPTVTAVSVKVVFASILSDAEQAAVKAAIVADATGAGENPRIGLAQRVYASRFWSAIHGATDTPLVSVQLKLGASGAWSDALTFTADVEPVFSSENIWIEVENG